MTPKRQRPSVPVAVREAVWRKTGGRCWYCDRQTSPWWDFTVDHDVPIARGGTNRLGNLVPCCRGCNERKGNRTGDEFRALLERGGAVAGPSRRRPWRRLAPLPQGALFLSVAEVAAALGLTVAAVKELIAEGYMGYQTLGSTGARVPVAEVQRWLDVEENANARREEQPRGIDH